MSTSLDRREFARLFSLGGSAALLGHPTLAGLRPTPLSAAEVNPGAAPDWARVREQFLMPRELSVLKLDARGELVASSPGAGDVGDWLDGFIFALAGPIYAGTNEIQRNIIAERILGLPRK